MEEHKIKRYSKINKLNKKYMAITIPREVSKILNLEKNNIEYFYMIVEKGKIILEPIYPEKNEQEDIGNFYDGMEE